MKKIKICICLLVLFSIFINGCSKNEPPEPIPFSSDEWINGEWKERYRMLEDLENNYELIGMSREEMTEKLSLAYNKVTITTGGFYYGCSRKNN